MERFSFDIFNPETETENKQFPQGFSKSEKKRKKKAHNVLLFFFFPLSPHFLTP